ncbi:aspartate--ammonia ligase [Candidatus Soleaferrea massiliensis]|uniref:aspartate--ammonia ligase n=1 Tax=Candidatus Soleaferrea massiliensis TaxID=1470354 RepID=UPI00058CCD8F|nr:aspartate--ammonia ligase [Candidatus Soleaferrea massiliensis]
MSVEKLILPEGYHSKLDIIETEIAIKLAKDTFERLLAERLNLLRVSAPLFVRPQTGLNDDLNGVERPVQFDIKELGGDVQIVHSLAKWKRLAIKRYGIERGRGLYTDMNAIRRDEDLDNLHSVYVDQWDWEKSIVPADRNMQTLKQTVHGIVDVLRKTQKTLHERFPVLENFLEQDVTFISTQELEDRWPNLTPNERENRIAKEKGIVFISGIGGRLRSGERHDGRAPDYDDWTLNGDILIWYPVLGRAVELSSMGIRVDAPSLTRQLELSGCEERRHLTFHRQLLSGELPLTMGGGIGQSRLCMVLLQKAHIGEVQASVWSDEMIETCEANGIHLL